MNMASLRLVLCVGYADEPEHSNRIAVVARHDVCCLGYDTLADVANNSVSHQLVSSRDRGGGPISRSETDYSPQLSGESVRDRGASGESVRDRGAVLNAQLIEARLVFGLVRLDTFLIRETTVHDAVV